jgi:hypothetical protein
MWRSQDMVVGRKGGRVKREVKREGRMCKTRVWE